MPDTQPFDHNGECLICDELAGHRADCAWLLGLLVEIEQLQKDSEVAQVKEMDQALQVERLTAEVDRMVEAKMVLGNDLQRQLAEREQVITNQLRTIGGLRAAFDAATKEAGELAAQVDRQAEELVKANEKVEALRKLVDVPIGDRPDDQTEVIPLPDNPTHK